MTQRTSLAHPSPTVKSSTVGNHSKITLTPVDPAGPAIEFDVIEFDVITGGVAVWQLNDEKHSKQSTTFTTVSAEVYTIPVRLGANAEVSVQAQFDRLRRWAKPSQAHGVTHEPVKLKVTGEAKVSATQKWVITNLTEIDQFRLNDGTLIQYDVTIELTEYVPPSAATLASSAQKANAKKAKKPKTKRTKKASGSGAQPWVNFGG